MKKQILLSLVLFSFFQTLIQSGLTQSIHEIEMRPGAWSEPDSSVEFISYKGVPGMKILKDRPPVELKDITFGDGTLEFDVEFLEGTFMSVYFRRKDESEGECFYFRPYRIEDPLGWDALQYAPVVDGITLWDLLGHYQAAANLKKGEWNHVKMVISGRQMLVYINETDKPTLYIPEMGSDMKSGKLAFQGNSIIANLVIKPGQVEGLDAKAAYDPSLSDPRYLRDWKHSPAYDLPFGQDLAEGVIPNDSTEWENIEAERLGLVNLTRVFGATERGTRRLTWLKINIESDQEQKRRLDLGFSDEVWVLINKNLLYIDKNYYGAPIMKEPRGRCAIENTSFDIPLQKGKNELWIGVGNFFFGWGIVARLESVEGLKIYN